MREAACVQSGRPWWGSLCLRPQPVRGTQAKPSPLPIGFRVWLGGPAGPEPSRPVQRLQEHALVAQAGPQERLRGALRGEREAASSPPLMLGAHLGGSNPCFGEARDPSRGQRAGVKSRMPNRGSWGGGWVS